MIKILICCEGGLSSSYLANQLNKQCILNHYEDKIQIAFSDFQSSCQLLHYYDVLMACPHLSYKIPDFIHKYGNVIPIYIIPPRMYGNILIEDIYEDACDILEGYSKSHLNPFHFPDEDKILHVKRHHSYRKDISNKKI